MVNVVVVVVVECLQKSTPEEAPAKSKEWVPPFGDLPFTANFTEKEDKNYKQKTNTQQLFFNTCQLFAMSKQHEIEHVS